MTHGAMTVETTEMTLMIGWVLMVLPDFYGTCLHRENTDTHSTVSVNLASNLSSKQTTVSPLSTKALKHPQLLFLLL